MKFMKCLLIGFLSSAVGNWLELLKSKRKEIKMITLFFIYVVIALSFSIFLVTDEDKHLQIQWTIGSILFIIGMIFIIAVTTKII